MADKPAIGKRGKRYSADEKAEIMKFITEFNAENKRGGMKAASDKYGVSVVTLSNWGKGSKSLKKRKVKGKTSKAAGKKLVKTATVAVKNTDETPDVILNRLQAIRAEIFALEKEYDGLKKKL